MKILDVRTEIGSAVMGKGGEVGMTNKEAIDIIKTAIAQVEWDYPMDYAAAFDKAIEALELLKGQEAVTPIKARQGRNEYYSYFLCPVCKNDIMFHQSYCEDCGRKMKWE